MINKNTILGICLLLTCGCALQPCKPVINTPCKSTESQVKALPVQQVNPTQQLNIVELLNYFDLYSNRDADAQKTMLNELNQALIRDPNNVLLRMKLAGTLALPASHYRDNAKAELQLQSLVKDFPLNRPVAALMGLLYEYTQESNKQQQKLREEVKRNEILDKKLNDLKNIEKTMIQRSSKLESP